MYFENTSVESVAELYKEGFVRSDHYSGEYVLYRLAACIPFNVPLSTQEALQYSHYLVDELYQLPIQPWRVRISRDYFEIEWSAQGFQVVNSKEQYAGLLLSFANFLDECPIIGIEVQPGFLCDDPGTKIEGIPSRVINRFPVFNQECFGSNKPIEVIY